MCKSSKVMVAHAETQQRDALSKDVATPKLSRNCWFNWKGQLPFLHCVCFQKCSQSTDTRSSAPESRLSWFELVSTTQEPLESCGRWAWVIIEWLPMEPLPAWACLSCGWGVWGTTQEQLRAWVKIKWLPTNMEPEHESSCCSSWSLCNSHSETNFEAFLWDSTLHPISTTNWLWLPSELKGGCCIKYRWRVLCERWQFLKVWDVVW